MSFLILSIGNEVNIQHRCQYRYDSFLIYIKDMIIQLISCFRHGFPCLNGLTDILSVWHKLNFWFLFFQSRNVNGNFKTVGIRWAELAFRWNTCNKLYNCKFVNFLHRVICRYNPSLTSLKCPEYFKYSDSNNIIIQKKKRIPTMGWLRIKKK